MVAVDGGELEVRYESLADQLADSKQAAAEVRNRITAVEDVADALFDEWRTELAQYSDATLRAKSEAQLRATRSRYDQLMKAMRRAEARLERGSR